MRVEFYTERSGRELQRDLNAALENHDIASTYNFQTVGET